MRATVTEKLPATVQINNNNNNNTFYLLGAFHGTKGRRTTIKI